ncbi:phosphonate C-P lyase system protein PhnH [Salicibibacter kimchii]|uniref:Phosphonate C-P lyase system protein PhnH n=1 Tax=Salicibibacter kimchii TaxID=2099786 RepID=A0A345BY79_9BACI|nr:phosphonate C-P lyase system protein PhnH [Salicibibacter kimchii]AXF55910.1 phosphonate C-P lyase system protein PhnH [Salicibibacter kimchii]
MAEKGLLAKSSTMEQDQSVFRSLLAAMANPGTIHRIQHYHAPNQKYFTSKIYINIAHALLDQEVSYYVHDNLELSKAIARSTFSKEASIENAEYLFFQGITDANIIESLEGTIQIGKLSSPEKGAMIFLDIDAFQSNGMIWTGPGIEQNVEIGISGLEQQWLDLRQELNQEYPLGVDMLFFTSAGDICALPRTTRIQQVEE